MIHMVYFMTNNQQEKEHYLYIYSWLHSKLSLNNVQVIFKTS